MNQEKTLGKKILLLTVVFAVLAVVFFWVVCENWEYTSAQTDPLTASGLIPLAETKEAVILQKFTSEADELEQISLVPGRIRPEAAGTIRVTLQDETGKTQRTIDLDATKLTYDEMNVIPLEPAMEGCRGQKMILRIDSGDTGVSFQYGKTITAGKFEMEAKDTEDLTVQGTPLEGKMVMATRGRNKLGLSWLAWVLAGLCYLSCLFVLIRTEQSVKAQKNDIFFMAAEVRKRYSFLLKQLVHRDFKTKYQASVLGVLWSFLNPLLSMTVYLLVFSLIFRSNIEYFPAYLLTGIVLFNYFSESTSQGLNSIVVNRALITKVYMPKMIYPLAKVLSSAVNLLISFIPMFIVMLVTGVPFHKSLLLLPLVVLFLVCFCLGMTLILSTLNVFFRDTQFLWGILITVWNFLTPIFYPETIIPAAFRTVYHMNPLYQIVYFMRCITVGGVSPTPLTYLYCCLAAFIPLGLGLYIFRKQQDRFVIYL